MTAVVYTAAQVLSKFAHILSTVIDYRRATCSGSAKSPTFERGGVGHVESGVGYFDTWGREGSTDDV